MSEKELFETIFSYGVPIIVATDVFPPPGKVVQIASSLGARLWYPKKSLSVAEKEAIARQFSYGQLGPENDHERDALAAAYAAFSHFSSKIRQVEHRLKEMGREDLFEEAVRAVIFGKSVDQALRPREKTKKEKRKRKRKEHTRVVPSEEVQLLLQRIEELKRENEDLRYLISRVRAPADEKLRLEKRALARKVTELQKELEYLRGEVDRLKEIIKGIGKGELKVVKGKRDDAIMTLDEFSVVEDVAGKIARMIEEYRRRREKHLF